MGNKITLFGGKYLFVINFHFGGPSVDCGQILQKNPGKGQTTTPPPSWQCQDFGNIWSPPTPSLNPYCRLVFYPWRFSFSKGGGDHFHSKIFHFRRILTIVRLYTMKKKKKNMEISTISLKFVVYFSKRWVKGCSSNFGSQSHSKYEIR